DRIEALTLAGSARMVRVRAFAPPPFLAGLLLVETPPLASRAATFAARAAPAVLGVEREQPRIELCEAAGTRRTRAARREDRRCSSIDRHVHDSLAEVQRSRKR